MKTSTMMTSAMPSAPVGKAWEEVSASFDRFCLAAGIETLGAMMEADAAVACGPRHSRREDRRGHRWGRTQGKIGFHAGKVVIERPRVRGLNGKELPLASWEQAVDGCEHVLHVASPFPLAQPKDPDELIVPARDGTLRVVRAALKAGASRVVVTSSVAAVGGSASGAGRTLDESDWTDLDDPSVTPYARSKTIAERAAWDLAEELGETTRLATVNPGAILGPVSGRTVRPRSKSSSAS